MSLASTSLVRVEFRNSRGEPRLSFERLLKGNLGERRLFLTRTGAVFGSLERAQGDSLRIAHFDPVNSRYSVWDAQVVELTDWQLTVESSLPPRTVRVDFEEPLTFPEGVPLAIRNVGSGTKLFQEAKLTRYHAASGVIVVGLRKGISCHGNFQVRLERPRESEVADLLLRGRAREASSIASNSETEIELVDNPPEAFTQLWQYLVFLSRDPV